MYRHFFKRLFDVLLSNGLWEEISKNAVDCAMKLKKKLIEAGFGKQIVFGQDTCFKVQLHTYGGYGYGHIFREIPEYAGNMGYRSEWLDDILRKNPARLFTGTEIE